MIRLRALGQCVFEVGAHRITPESDVLFAVLLLLACRQGQAMRRVELLELLWPESDERSARHRLRQALYQVRKLGAPVASAESSVSLRRRDVELDYVVCRQSREAFLASLASARASRSASTGARSRSMFGRVSIQAER